MCRVKENLLGWRSYFTTEYTSVRTIVTKQNKYYYPQLNSEASLLRIYLYFEQLQQQLKEKDASNREMLSNSFLFLPPEMQYAEHPFPFLALSTLVFGRRLLAYRIRV